jgi:hypothetical protein
MRFLPRDRVRGVAFVLLLSVSGVAVAVSGVAPGSTASRSLIAIHEQGTNNLNGQSGNGATHGTFTIELQKAPFGPGGTTVIYAIPSGTGGAVKGQEQIPFVATDHLTGKTGKIVLAVKGTHIDVNSKLNTSGQVVGPAAEYGTWKIRTATGIYQGWKGGGNWASVAYSYRNVQPYSVEWDGYITR